MTSLRTFIRKALLLTLVASLPVCALSQTPSAGRMYGAGHPFAPQDLPASRLRADLESLPTEAQKRALENLHRFTFPAADAAHLRVDKAGGVFYEDPVPPSAPSKTKPVGNGATGSSLSVQQITSSVPSNKAFKLHSKPGATKVIYLNMVGATVTGTIWNTNSGFSSLTMLPYSQDADYSSFTQSELDAVAETWKRIAEDYAPFDVDVTTEAPASFGPNVGHILVTRKTDLYGNAIYNCSCGGVAYVGVWGASNYPYYQPALVFTDGVGTGPHNIAEAASHEMGHNLSLSHDGTASTGYYTGQGSGNVDWAPIMGVGYYGQVTQWSKGEYSGANNTQDDLALIGQRLAYRADDHESTNFSKATPLVISGTNVYSTTPVTDPDNANKANKGIIETRADVDLFVMNVEAGTVDLTVTPVWLDVFQTQSYRGTNLDVRASLYSANGTPIASSDPLTDTYARVTTTVPTGSYILAVEGVGVGDPLVSGYTDYASIGQYFINGTVPKAIPAIQLGSTSYSVTEGGSVNVTITRSMSAGASSVNYTTADGTAIAGSDYSTASGVVSFADGQTSATITIATLEDVNIESNEAFSISLSNPSGAVLGAASGATVTIIDNDVPPPPTISFGSATYSVGEAGVNVTISVTRSSTTGSSSVNYATANQTANAGQDYTAKSGTITFAAGVSTVTINIPIINDKKKEAAETFVVNLSGPVSGTLGSIASTTVTIIDND